VENLLKQKYNIETELAELQRTTVQEMWLKELEVFEKEYTIYKTKRAQGGNDSGESQSEVPKSGKVTKSIKVQKSTK
jgi:hypothetical protein